MPGPAKIWGGGGGGVPEIGVPYGVLFDKGILLFGGLDWSCLSGNPTIWGLYFGSLVFVDSHIYFAKQPRRSMFCGAVRLAWCVGLRPTLVCLQGSRGFEGLEKV